MIDQKTDYLQLPLPNAENLLEEDVQRLCAALQKVDAHARATGVALGEKADEAAVNAALGGLASALGKKADGETVRSELEDILKALETHAAKAASASDAGHVKVINSVTSSSTTDAAAAASVKSAYDRAVAAENAIPSGIKGKSWSWSGQSGQPSWVWGSNDGTNMLVWNPSAFSVGYASNANYANSAGYATNAGFADSTFIAQKLNGNVRSLRLIDSYAYGCDLNGNVSDGVLTLGSSSARWGQIYSTSGSISTSDAREKSFMHGDGSIPEAVFRAWGKVRFAEYQMLDAIAAKGDKARIHTGLIAQQIKEAFESEGLDPFARGLLCYDAWDAQEEITETYTVEVTPAKFEMREVEITPAVLDDAGNIITPAITLLQPVEVAPAVTEERTNIIQSAREVGNRFALRYEEALCLEAAYQRRRADAAETRLQQAESTLASVLERLEKLENNHA